MNEYQLDVRTCSIHDLWSYYCHRVGIWQLPEHAQNDHKASYYSGFAAMLAILDLLPNLEEHDAAERLQHLNQELKFSHRKHLNGSLSRS